MAVGTPRLELTAPWMSASCAGDVPNIIYVSEPVPVSWVRWRRAAAVCAAGEVNIFASEPRLVYFGGSENIPRPLAGGSDAGGGDATTRAPVRAKESNPTYSHEHDPGKTPAGGRSRRRPGAFVASSPVAEELGQLERKPKTAATPRTRFPRKRSPARRTRGRARIRRTGLQRRVRSPSIRSSVRGARSRIARFGDARIPTSRPAPVSPVFPLAWTGKCAEAWAGERAFERSASSPLRCEGSSTFARVLACRHRGVSKSEDWRAAVNRVRRGAAQEVFEPRAPSEVDFWRQLPECQRFPNGRTNHSLPKSNGNLDWETTVSRSPSVKKAEIPGFNEPRLHRRFGTEIRPAPAAHTQVAKKIPS